MQGGIEVEDSSQTSAIAASPGTRSLVHRTRVGVENGASKTLLDKPSSDCDAGISLEMLDSDIAEAEAHRGGDHRPTRVDKLERSVLKRAT